MGSDRVAVVSSRLTPTLPKTFEPQKSKSIQAIPTQRNDKHHRSVTFFIRGVCVCERGESVTSPRKMRLKILVDVI